MKNSKEKSQLVNLFTHESGDDTSDPGEHNIRDEENFAPRRTDFHNCFTAASLLFIHNHLIVKLIFLVCLLNLIIDTTTVELVLRRLSSSPDYFFLVFLFLFAFDLRFLLAFYAHISPQEQSYESVKVVKDHYSVVADKH